MSKLKILLFFAVHYVVFCVLANLVIRCIYGDPITIGKSNWINMFALPFFYLTVYKPYAEIGLFDISLTLDRQFLKGLLRNYGPWLKYYFRKWGIVEAFYLVYLFYHAYLESSMGYTLNNSLYILLYSAHLGFWLWLWPVLSFCPARTVAYRLIRKKVSSEGYTPRRKDTAVQSGGCCAES